MVWFPVQSKQYVPGTPVLVKWNKGYLAAVVADPASVVLEPGPKKELEMSYKEVRARLGPCAHRAASQRHVTPQSQDSPAWVARRDVRAVSRGLCAARGVSPHLALTVCLTHLSAQILTKLQGSGKQPVLVVWVESNQFSYMAPDEVANEPADCRRDVTLGRKELAAFEKLRAKHAGTTAPRGPKGAGAVARVDTPPQGHGGAGAPSAEGAQREEVLPAKPGERCRSCGATETPQWRNGPDGPRTLCNACNSRWRTKGKPATAAGLATAAGTKRKQEDTPPSEAGHPGAARKSMPASSKHARTEPRPGDVAGADAGVAGAAAGGSALVLAGDPRTVLVRVRHQLTALSCKAESSTAAEIQGLLNAISKARDAVRNPTVTMSAECSSLADDLFAAEWRLERLQVFMQSRGVSQPPSEVEMDSWRQMARFAVVPSGSELERLTADMRRIAGTEGQPATVSLQLQQVASNQQVGRAAWMPAAAAAPGQAASVSRPVAVYAVPQSIPARSPTHCAAAAPSASPPPSMALSPTAVLDEKEAPLLLRAVLEMLTAQPAGFKLTSFDQPVYNRLMQTDEETKREWNRRLGVAVEKGMKGKLAALLSMPQVLQLVAVDMGSKSIRITDAGKKYLQERRSADAEQQQPGAARSAAGAPQTGPGGGSSGAGPSSQAGKSRPRKDVAQAAAVAVAPSDELDEITEAAIKALRGQGRLSFQEFEERMRKLRGNVGKLRDSFGTRSTQSRWYLFGILAAKQQRGGSVIWLHEPALENGPPEPFLYQRLHAAGAGGMTVREALKCLSEAYPHLAEMADTGSSVKFVTAFNLDFLKTFQSGRAGVVWTDGGARLALTAEALALPKEQGASRPLRPAKQPRAAVGAGVRKVQGPKLGLDRVEITSADVKAMSPEVRRQYDMWLAYGEDVRKEADKAVAAAAAAAPQAGTGTVRRGGGAPRGALCHLCDQPASGCPPCASCPAVFCTRCMQDCFITSRMSEQALRERCPVCRGVCFCATCSSQPQWRDLARFGNASLAEKQEHAQYMLAVTKEQLKEVQRQQQAAEVAAGGVAPKRMDPRVDGGGRMNCDGCNTSLADMCWCCDEAGGCCQVDLCLICAETLRAGTMPLLLRTRFDPASVPPVPPGGQLLCPCYYDQGRKAAGPSKRRGPEEHGCPLLTLQSIMDAPALVGGVLAGLPEALRSMSGDVQGDRAHAFRGPTGGQPARPEPCPWCCRLASLTEPDVNGVQDLRTNPNLRRAAWRGSPDDWLWTPHADDVDRSKLSSEQYRDTMAHFQWHFRRRQFPVVRGLTPQLAWTPGQLRVLLQQQEAEDERVTQVLWCRDGATGPCSAEDFAAAFGDLMQVPFARGEDEKNGKLFAQLGDMLKLKDWPAEKSFGEAVPRHCYDFITMLPFQEYTNMRDGPLNLATSLPQVCCPPDLGPKSYVAHGVQQERGGPAGGDSVTRLHMDMSDAVNVLYDSRPCDGPLVEHVSGHSQTPLVAQQRRDDDVYQRSSLGPEAWALANQLAAGHQAAVGSLMRCMPDQEAVVTPKVVVQEVMEPKTAGALWHTFRREDTLALGDWLLTRLDAWKAAPDEAGKRAALSCGVVCTAAEVDHPIHSQAFYLGTADLAALKQDTGGLEPWGFYQYDNECVFIPAGCPHQVRNTRSCIKVALDFVSPEAVRECNALSAEYAKIGMEDKLQGRAMLIHGAKAALDTLTEQGGAQVA